MTDNMTIWNALAKTDPKHTKPFQRAGGFKGTAIKPIWTIQRITEHFGPVGDGWGMEKPDFQTISAEGEILVYCTLAVWYRDGTRRSEPFYGVGGDKVVSKSSSGLRTSDEAFKAAYTDALGNAIKLLGVAADVHMGLFDDSKYVREVEREFKAAKETQRLAEQAPVTEADERAADRQAAQFASDGQLPDDVHPETGVTADDPEVQRIHKQVSAAIAKAGAPDKVLAIQKSDHWTWLTDNAPKLTMTTLLHQATNRINSLNEDAARAQRAGK